MFTNLFSRSGKWVKLISAVSFGIALVTTGQCGAFWLPAESLLWGMIFRNPFSWPVHQIEFHIINVRSLLNHNEMARDFFWFSHSARTIFVGMPIRVCLHLEKSQWGDDLQVQVYKLEEKKQIASFFCLSLIGTFFAAFLAQFLLQSRSKCV